MLVLYQASLYYCIIFLYIYYFKTFNNFIYAQYVSLYPKSKHFKRASKDSFTNSFSPDRSYRSDSLRI